MYRPLIMSLLVAVVAGCAIQPKIETADDLADALKRKGVVFVSNESIEVPNLPFGRIDEGLSLTGENLQVEILRITDDRTYSVATGAASILLLVKAKAPEMPAQAPDVYLSKPFAVIIRAEPTEGAVRTALEKIIPEDVDEP